MGSSLNKNQRAVASEIVLGVTSDDEIAEKLVLTKETVQRIKRELRDKFGKLFLFERQLAEKIEEASELENDIGLLKQLFLEKQFGYLKEEYS